MNAAIPDTRQPADTVAEPSKFAHFLQEVVERQDEQEVSIETNAALALKVATLEAHELLVAGGA
jgi:hypothetical protein